MDTPLPTTTTPTGSGRSPATIRRMGWLLIFIGPLLSGGVAWLMSVLWTIANRANPAPGEARFTGSHEVLVDTFLLLGSLCVFGVVSFVIGIFQVRYARRSGLLLAVFFLVLAVVVGSGIKATLAAKAIQDQAGAAP